MRAFRELVNSPALLLRKTEYGESDLIVTLLSPGRGRLTAVAPAARKSRRRFGGVLEVFTEFQAVLEAGGGWWRLREASLTNPHARIRESPLRTAYAGVWTELAHDWAEEGSPQEELYGLLGFALSALDRGEPAAEVLHPAFLMRLLELTGHAPALERCVGCRAPADSLPGRELRIDLGRGGVCCPRCAQDGLAEPFLLSRGAAKQLLWIGRGPTGRLARLKAAPAALAEGRSFVERFLLRHLDRMPRSFEVLRQLDGGGAGRG